MNSNDEKAFGNEVTRALYIDIANDSTAWRESERAIFSRLRDYDSMIDVDSKFREWLEEFWDLNENSAVANLARRMFGEVFWGKLVTRLIENSDKLTELHARKFGDSESLQNIIERGADSSEWGTMPGKQYRIT